MLKLLLRLLLLSVLLLIIIVMKNCHDNGGIYKQDFKNKQWALMMIGMVFPTTMSLLHHHQEEEQQQNDSHPQHRPTTTTSTTTTIRAAITITQRQAQQQQQQRRVLATVNCSSLSWFRILGMIGTLAFCLQAQLRVSSPARDPALRRSAFKLLELVCVCISTKLRSYSSGTRIQAIWW